MRAVHVRYIKPKTLKEIRKVGMVIQNTYSGNQYIIQSLHHMYVRIKRDKESVTYPVNNRNLMTYNIIDPNCKYGIAIGILKGRA